MHRNSEINEIISASKIAEQEKKETQSDET